MQLFCIISGFDRGIASFGGGSWVLESNIRGGTLFAGEPPSLELSGLYERDIPTSIHFLEVPGAPINRQ